MKVKVIYKANWVFYYCHVMMVCKENEKLFAFDHSGTEYKRYGNLTNTKYKHYDKDKLSKCSDYVTFYTDDKTFKKLEKWEKEYRKKSYNILTYNCIHLVRDVLKGFFKFDIKQIPPAWVFFFGMPIPVLKNPKILNPTSFFKGVKNYVDTDKLFLLDNKKIKPEIESVLKRVLSHHKKGKSGKKVTVKKILQDFKTLHKHFPHDSLIYFRKGEFYEQGLKKRELAFKHYCLAYKHINNRELRFAMTQYKLPTKRNIIRRIVGLVYPDKKKDLAFRDKVAKLFEESIKNSHVVSIKDIKGLDQVHKLKENKTGLVPNFSNIKV